jgi:thiamine-phosphate pyrophosphorylase
VKHLLPRLCAIADADVAARANWTLIDLASAYLIGGARFLQVRAKGAPAAWLLDTTSAIVALARRAGGIVVVNDRADIARLAGADGVHLGQRDLAPVAARTVLDRAGLIGLSTHTLDQIDAAVLEPIDYLASGPVFVTATKATGYDPIGLQRVREAAARAHPRGLPVVAIGGITLDRAAEVVRAGAASVAVISDLLATGDPVSRVREYLERLGGP